MESFEKNYHYRNQRMIFIEDEDRFLQLFQHAPVGISEVDAHTNKFIRVNPKLCQMLGYTQEELLDRTTQELTHPDDRALDKEFIDKWKLGEPILYHREKRYLCKNGGIIWADLNVTPMQDAEGRALFNLAVVIDITERKELEAELQKIQERFRLATLATRVGVWEYDLKTDRYWASESLDLIFGHTDPIEKWNRRIFMDQIHPADRDEVDAGIQKAVTNKSGWDLEFRVIWPDQTLHWLNAKGQVLLDEKGHPISMTGTTFEISEKKKAEFEREHLFSQLQTEKQSLEESKELLQATVGDLVQERKMRERFVATLTHDLRTPLTAIKMSAQMLLHRGSDPDVIKKVAPRIVENIDRADRMIRDLLDANRIKAGEHLALDISPCSLPYQIQKTLEELEAVHGPRFEFKTPGDIQGYWSPSAIRRIIENLCSNAVKYGQTNGPVKISLRKNSDHVSIDVCNQGPVITVQDQKTLFAPFRRTNSALSGPAKGWGLGLTLVKGLAEAHGGSVSVKSTKSAGTCFSVNLPLDARPFQKI